MALPATDTFTNTNGVTLQTHNANWIDALGELQIYSNACRPAISDAYSLSYWTGDTFNNNQYSQTVAVAVTADNWQGPAVRCGQSDNIDNGYQYQASLYNNGYQYAGKEISEMVDGAVTVLDSIYYDGVAVNDVMRLEVSGTTLTPKLNGSLDTDLGTTTDSTFSSGRAGVSGYGNSIYNLLDTWEGGNLGGTSTPMTLAGGFTPSGVLTKSLPRTLAGGFTPAGVLTKSSPRTFAGTIGSSQLAGVLTATLGKIVGPRAVGGSADDASELADTVVSITANPLANCDTAGVWNAWVFRNITIPAGATIVSSYITINFTSTSLDEPDVRIYGLDTATPAAFQANNADISGRARTTAYVDWAVANAGGDDVNTGSLNTIVNELVTSYAPYSAGVMGFCWTSRANDSARDTSETAYDGSSTLCARLYITYTVAVTMPSGTSTPMTLTGTITSEGVLTRVLTLNRTLTGGATPTGALSKIVNLVRTLIGGITPTGVLISQHPRILTGGITPTGTLIKSSPRTFTGGFTPTGILSKVVNLVRTFIGDVTPAGAIVWNLLRTITGAITPTGIVTYYKAVLRAFDGAITPTGDLAKSLLRTITGATTPAGELVKSLLRTLTGTITPTGALDYYKAIVKAFDGAITPTGALSQIISYVRTLTGSITPAGDLVKSLSRTIAGAITPTGVLTALKATLKTFDGVITPAGDLIKQLLRTFAGTVNSVGTYVGGLLVSITRFVQLTLSSRSKALTILDRTDDLTLEARSTDLTLNSRSNDLTLNSRSDDLTLEERGNDS